MSFSGMLVKELALESGVQKRAIDSYLLRENPSMPPADNAVKIARALGVTVEHLITGEEAVLPTDIRLIVRNLLRLDEKDRKVAAILVKALLDK
ncbi:MAG: helix-turn-helix domain-containing protein [Treponema sp.]|nr:helix-turn-helix domain-containing protein [Treponema sp.]